MRESERVTESERKSVREQEMGWWGGGGGFRHTAEH